MASSLIVLPRSLLCSVCHSAGCRRYFLGGNPSPLPYTIPSSDRLNPIRRLNLTFLRLSTTIDYRSYWSPRKSQMSNTVSCYIRPPIYYHSDIFCNSDFLQFGSSLISSAALPRRKITRYHVAAKLFATSQSTNTPDNLTRRKKLFQKEQRRRERKKCVIYYVL